MYRNLHWIRQSSAKDSHGWRSNTELLFCCQELETPHSSSSRKKVSHCISYQSQYCIVTSLGSMDVVQATSMLSSMYHFFQKRQKALRSKGENDQYQVELFSSCFWDFEIECIKKNLVATEVQLILRRITCCRLATTRKIQSYSFLWMIYTTKQFNTIDMLQLWVTIWTIYYRRPPVPPTHLAKGKILYL